MKSKMLCNGKKISYIVENENQLCNGKVSECMILSSHRYGLLLRRQVWMNPVWLGGLLSPAALALSRPPFGLATLA